MTLSQSDVKEPCPNANCGDNGKLCSTCEDRKTYYARATEPKPIDAQEAAQPPTMEINWGEQAIQSLKRMKKAFYLVECPAAVGNDWRGKCRSRLGLSCSNCPADTADFCISGIEAIMRVLAAAPQPDTITLHPDSLAIADIFCKHGIDGDKPFQIWAELCVAMRAK